jgi:protein involved in polysaccharide export with SLBB domain
VQRVGRSLTGRTPAFSPARLLIPTLASLVLATCGLAQAQTTGDETGQGNYGAQAGATGSLGGQFGGQGLAAGANAPSYNGSQPNGPYYAPGGGQIDTYGQGGTNGPLYIPNQTEPNASEDPQTGPTRLYGQQSEPFLSGPLYARPADQPGQFLLFRRPPPQLSEFEKFVKENVGRPLPRFGSSLILNGTRGFALAPTTTVPPDYALNPGDELVVGVTGAVEASLRLAIDRDGRVFIPKIGAVNVAGLRYGDLAAALSRKFGEQYKHVSVSVGIGRLHGLSVYVTGYAVSPGAYTVSSLSTMANAILAAGGPAPGGSFRSIRLRRNGELISTLDLYDLLLNGNRTHDVVLQNGDVLDIGPVGPELAVTGSVNAEAIYEARSGETLGDIIGFAGGPNSLADDTRVIVVRLADLDREGSRQLSYAEARAFPAERGDIVRLLSLGEVARPQERQAILATIEGEVDRPGRYYLKPGSTLGDLVLRAGGLTGGAYPFATEIDRESVRRQQEATYSRSIDDLELAASVAPLAGRGSTATADNAAADAARLQIALASIERLRQRKPDGRLVLNLPPEASALPASVLLENNDRIFVTPRPKTVGVFGAVYRPGSFLYGDVVRLGDYLKLAGGPQHFADRGEMYVVRANGSVISTRDDHHVADRAALPGDLIFVPVRTSPSPFQRFLDLSAIVYQFGVSALTIRALTP